MTTLLAVGLRTSLPRLRVNARHDIDATGANLALRRGLSLTALGLGPMTWGTLSGLPWGSGGRSLDIGARQLLGQEAELGQEGARHVAVRRRRLGAMVVVGPFAGAREHVITGSVLLAFAAAWAVLAVLSERWTDQPQRWAFVPAAFSSSFGGRIWSDAGFIYVAGYGLKFWV